MSHSVLYVPKCFHYSLPLPTQSSFWSIRRDVPAWIANKRTQKTRGSLKKLAVQFFVIWGSISHFQKDSKPDLLPNLQSLRTPWCLPAHLWHVKKTNPSHVAVTMKKCQWWTKTILQIYFIKKKIQQHDVMTDTKKKTLSCLKLIET